MSARRKISWGAAVSDMKSERNVVRLSQKWIQSRGALLAYKPVRVGPATELLGLVQTGGPEIVANVLGYSGTLHEVGRFANDMLGLRAARQAVELAIEAGEAA